MGTSYRIRANVPKKVEKAIVAFLKGKNAEDLWRKFETYVTDWNAEALFNELSEAFPKVAFSEETACDTGYERNYRLNGICLSEETVYPEVKTPTEKQFHRAYQDLLERKAEERKAAEAQKVKDEEDRQKRIEELKAELGKLESAAA